jgi:hypothetical protein
VPRPDVISTLSDANMAIASESSEKPTTDDISPAVVAPATSIPGYRAWIAERTAG